jgi:hypothetical protein
MILGVFEMENIICATMANQVKALLNPFHLFDKVIAYVKDERFNLNGF